MITTTYKWTIDRYHQAIQTDVFDNQLVELLRGEIITLPSEDQPHAYYTSETGNYLRALLGSQAKIREAHPSSLATLPNPFPTSPLSNPWETSI